MLGGGGHHQSCFLFLALFQIAWIFPFILLMLPSNNKGGSWIFKRGSSHPQMLHFNNYVKGTIIPLQSSLLSPSPTSSSSSSSPSPSPSQHLNLSEVVSGARNNKNAAKEAMAIKSRFEESGLVGPFQGIMLKEELTPLPLIWQDWERLRFDMNARLSKRGFGEVSMKSCFMWLPGCSQLARNGEILKIVKQILGSDVLLHGISIRKGENETLSQYHSDPEVLTCGSSLNVLVGSNLHYIKHSEKLKVKVTKEIVKSLQDAHNSLDKELADRALFIEEAGISKVKSYLRNYDVQSVFANVGELGFVAYNGQGIYRISGAAQTSSLLLQFVSAQCWVRDAHDVSWAIHRMQKAIFLPPLLSVSGQRSELKIDCLNDIRQGLASQEAPFLIQRDDAIPHSSTKKQLLHSSNITVYYSPNTTMSLPNLGGSFKVFNYGMASTSLLSTLRLDYYSFFCKPLRKDTLTFIESNAAQVFVVINGTLLFHRALVDDPQYREVIELVPGSAIFLSNKQLHSFVPVSSDVAVISIHWVGKEAGFSKGAASFSHLLFKSKEVSKTFTDAIEGRTITLKSGQAYDPDNDDCDGILVMVSGSFLQILPMNIMIKASDLVLIPMGESCLFWNTGNAPVTFFVTHLCRFEAQTQMVWSGDPRAIIRHASSGRVMK